jgi:hypothetical protein
MKRIYLIPWLVILTLFVSLSPWLVELFATPIDRIFTGINRWSTDYHIYLSYVEQGVRGFLSTKLIFTTQSHPSVFFYLAYTIPGFIFGHILGLNSVFIYHFFRALYGLVFLSATVIFFYKLSKSKVITLTAFFFTFYLSGFVKITSLFPFQATRYLEWLQEQNIIGRATGPLHYSVGFIIFISAFILYFYSKIPLLKKTFLLGLLFNGLLLTNPFNFLLIILCFASYLLIKLVVFKKNIELFHEILVISGATLISLPLFLLLNHYLSIPPWGIIGVSPKFYVATTPPISLFEAAMSVGPIFFLGIFGAIKLLNEQILRNQGRINYLYHDRSIDILIFLIIWPIIQFCLLIFGDSLKIHPPRAFSGLYYLPLSYFSAYFIVHLSKKINASMYPSSLPLSPRLQRSRKLRWTSRYTTILIILILFLITLPNYYLSYKEHLFAFTDFKYFSPLIYPSKKQVEAFKFLEKNTPAYSGVLALYEASSLINGFSGNSTETDLDQNFKILFYSNKLNNIKAKEFLIKYHFQYVYFGYQEEFTGGNLNKYPFLKKIFENKEVKIFHVL